MRILEEFVDPFQDEHGKNIVFDDGNYWIVADTLDNAEYITLWYNGKKVGSLGTRNYGAPYTDYMGVGSVDIDPKHRNQGYASKMYQALMKYMHKKYKGLITWLPDLMSAKIKNWYISRGAKYAGDDYLILDRNKLTFEHRLPTFEDYVNELDKSYKQVDFYSGAYDPMFDYYHPDLESMGIKNPTEEQQEQTYIATNKKRHLHIQVHPDLQKKGLAAEMIKAFIYLHGYRIVPKGRITNPDFIKVLNKVGDDPGFEVSDEGNFYSIDEL